jgi:porin
MSGVILRCVAGVAMACAPLAVAAAPPMIAVTPYDPDNPGQNSGSGPFGFLDGVERSSALFGNLWGLRPLLGRNGITLQIQETSEFLGNVSGGSRRGAAYDGLTTALMQIDTQRAFGWWGGLLNISALQYHGRNLSTDNLQSLQTASGIEADRATRLWEAWFQQKLTRDGLTDIRIGQQSLDQEFMLSQNGLYFVNTMFGWPMLPSADLPGGGPAYPLSSVGGRIKSQLSDAFQVLFGVYSGNPSPRRSGDSQLANPSGTSFPFNGGALLIGEVQYAYPGPGTMLYADEPEPLPRTLKLGFWYHTGHFDDLHTDSTGLSLANPASSGIARRHAGDFSLYAVADQTLWIDAQENDRTVNVFARVLGAPQTDRNLIDFSLNAGLTFHEPFLHRDDDVFGVGLGYAHVSRVAAALDADTAAYTGGLVPRRGGETYLEVTYQYAVTPWWQIQPDVQYTFNPGGGLANPNNPNARIRDELVLGVRTNILF